MIAKRILGSVVILLGLWLLSTPAFTDKPESVLPYDRDAATKASPQRTTVPKPPAGITCGACYLDDWTNKRRECCTTGTTNCWVESCPIPPDVLK